MNTSAILAYPGNERLARGLAQAGGGELVPVEVRAFPDGESYVRVEGGVRDREVTIVCSLHQPDAHFLRLALLAETARELGATRLRLVAPYLSYMRQDSRFHPGEGVTSAYFARLLSGVFDALLTLDPHLHRWSSLEELYTIPARSVSAAPAVAQWVREHVKAPLIVGPDAESAQWVEELAGELGAPSLVLEKTRRGDRDVSVELEAGALRGEGLTPVVLDDIVSTGRTMVVAVELLRELGYRAPVCVGIHAVFSDDAMSAVLEAGAQRLVTCDTIAHESNAISVDGLLIRACLEARGW